MTEGPDSPKNSSAFWGKKQLLKVCRDGDCLKKRKYHL